jgi:hypothetical protein
MIVCIFCRNLFAHETIARSQHHELMRLYGNLCASKMNRFFTFKQKGKQVLLQHYACPGSRLIGAVTKNGNIFVISF